MANGNRTKFKLGTGTEPRQNEEKEIKPRNTFNIRYGFIGNFALGQTRGRYLKVEYLKNFQELILTVNLILPD